MTDHSMASDYEFQRWLFHAVPDELATQYKAYRGWLAECGAELRPQCELPLPGEAVHRRAGARRQGPLEAFGCVIDKALETLAVSLHQMIEKALRYAGRGESSRSGPVGGAEDLGHELGSCGCDIRQDAMSRPAGANPPADDGVRP